MSVAISEIPRWAHARALAQRDCDRAQVAFNLASDALIEAQSKLLEADKFAATWRHEVTELARMLLGESE